MKKKIRVIQLTHNGRLWLPLRVQALATDRALRAAVRRHLFASVDWPRTPASEKRARAFLWKLGGPERLPVTATIKIDDYLTDKVPRHLTEKTVEIRSEGEALCVAAAMYLRVYRENERRGDEPAIMTEADMRRRLVRRRKAARRRRSFLVNRGCDQPLVWGHDLCDLEFELMHIRWTGKQTCVVTFSIGS